MRLLNFALNFVMLALAVIIAVVQTERGSYGVAIAFAFIGFCILKIMYIENRRR